MFKRIHKAISIVILAAFISASIKSPAFAQADPMPFMPKPGVMVRLSPEFTPAYLKGIVIHPENALKFDFIIYKGDKELTEAQKKVEYTKLTKYFLASLAIPDDDQWVNLSPYEKDRIIKDDFGKTEMGRDLLAQDYMLKQITASLIYPEDNLGQKFWDRVYAQAREQFGTTNIPVNTFNKVWILPDDALIYEKGNTAYVVKNHLRVMLEEDYLSLEKHSGIVSTVISKNDINSLGSKIVREIVLPELQREVNEGKNFAPLRQIYSGMLLAAWYKRTLKESLLSKIYANKGKVKGIDQDPKANEEIYQQYLKAYKKGVFNFIKEDMDKYTNETIPKKYFSGGAGSYDAAQKVLGTEIKVEYSLLPEEAKYDQARLSKYDYAQVVANVTNAASRRWLLGAAAVGVTSLFMPTHLIQAAQVPTSNSQEARRRKAIYALTKILMAADMTQLPEDQRDGNGLDSLMDAYRNAILEDLTNAQIQGLSWGQMVNANDGNVQKALLKVMFDIAKRKNDATILKNMITQAVNAFLEQMGPPKEVQPDDFRNYLAFLQKIIADSGVKELLAGGQMQRIRKAIETAEYLIQIENMTDVFREMQRKKDPGEAREAIKQAIDFWRRRVQDLAPEQDRLIGLDIRVEPDNGKEVYSNGRRAIMVIGDRVFEHFVADVNLEKEWQDAVEPNLIFKANESVEEARRLFAEDYLAFIVTGDLAKTHWIREDGFPPGVESGYFSEKNIEARRAFFNKYIFPNKVPTQPTMYDLQQRLKAINDAAMTSDTAMTAPRRWVIAAGLATLASALPTGQIPADERNNKRGGGLDKIIFRDKKLLFVGQEIIFVREIVSGRVVNTVSDRVEVDRISQIVDETGTICYQIDLKYWEGPLQGAHVSPSPRVFINDDRPSEFKDEAMKSEMPRRGVIRLAAGLALFAKRAISQTLTSGIIDQESLDDFNDYINLLNDGTIVEHDQNITGEEAKESLGVISPGFAKLYDNLNSIIKAYSDSVLNSVTKRDYNLSDGQVPVVFGVMIIIANNLASQHPQINQVAINQLIQYIYGLKEGRPALGIDIGKDVAVRLRFSDGFAVLYDNLRTMINAYVRLTKQVTDQVTKDDIILSEKMIIQSRTPQELVIPHGPIHKAVLKRPLSKQQTRNFGGIDLNSANLAMIIKRDSKGVPLAFAQQDMAQLNLIQGLEPVVLSIKPANNIPNFSNLFKSVNG